MAKEKIETPKMEMENVGNDQKTSELKEKKEIILKNNTIIEGKFHKKGEKIPLTNEVKKLLKPLGYTF